MSEYLNEDICQFSNDASASSFGWNFQANAGIFLFLKYMPDAADIKIESISQDIEITLIDERKVFAQAKSAQDSTTIKDQKEKFKDAIISLARNPYKDNQLVYISNIPDTFKSAPNFFNNSIIPYNDCLAGIHDPGCIPAFTTTRSCTPGSFPASPPPSGFGTPAIALYYGLNALSNNMILADRKKLKNPKGEYRKGTGTPRKQQAVRPQAAQGRGKGRATVILTVVYHRQPNMERGLILCRQ